MSVHHMRIPTLLLLSTTLFACGRAAEETDYKMAGVGSNPDEIESSPELYGGLIEVDWIEFAGGTLPLGLVGLVSFAPTQPDAGTTFEPPYAVVYGSAFIMDGDVPATDVGLGNFAKPPSKVGNCYTIYEPAGGISGVTDVGSYIDLSTADGSKGFTMGRRPLHYPPDVQELFPYYLDLGAWRDTPRYGYTAPDKAQQDISKMTAEVVSRPNFPFGEITYLSFPGAIPPVEASFSSIPYPSAAGHNADDGTNPFLHQLPNRPEGVMMSWDGPQYSGDGIELGSGSVSTCLQFQAHDKPPTAAEDCLALQALGEPVEGQYPRGQVYTAPWQTADGVTFDWVPATNDVDETLSISIRFLGPVDTDNEDLNEGVVSIEPNSSAEDAWDRAISEGTIPEGAEITDGRRAALACDDDADVEWLFDDNLLQGGDYLSSLQGSPFSNVAEVTCNLDEESGSFTLTSEILADALAYARQHNAKGAIFYINRSTRTPLDLPPVRDFVGKKHETEEVLVVSNAVQLGRFWVGSDGI
jgi:hypothetical protein